jgi:pyruvate,orthophosphate dikinase
VRKLGVRANAETPEDARTARKFGAEGIGLCRTEHMFFEETASARARDDPRRRRGRPPRRARQAAADAARDFVELFEIMAGLPVTIRLLDPPLHEFLPHTEEEIAEVAAAMNTDPRSSPSAPASCTSSTRCSAIRGCRLGIAYPEIAEMQARAIFEAAVEWRESAPARPVGPEVMVPLIATKAELRSGQGAHRRDGAGGDEGDRRQARLSGRHHDRAAARRLRAARSPRRRVLLVRHQRPDPDHLRHQPRRRRPLPRHYMSSKGIFERDPFVSHRRDGVGELIAHRRRARAQGARPDSSSASAASMAAIRLDRVLRRGRASITSRARPTACRSRGSPRRRRRSSGPPASLVMKP